MSRRPPSDPSAAQAGFTLIEVLVALGVCGLGLAAIAPVVAANAQRVRQSDSRLALAAAGRAVIESLPPRGEMREGAREGDLNGAHWRMSTTAMPGAADAAPASPWIAYRVAVDLTMPDGAASRIETIRLGRRDSR